MTASTSASESATDLPTLARLYPSDAATKAWSEAKPPASTAASAPRRFGTSAE